MPFVPAPNIIMAEVRATLDGQHIENRFMVNALAAVTPTNLEAVANLVNVWAQAHYFNQLPSQVALTEVVATDMTTDTGDQVSIAPVGPFVGAYDGGAMPNEVSLCVSLRSGARGRSARGRAYVLALPRSQVVANNVTSGYATAVTAAFNELITALSGGGFALTIVSYRHGGGPRVGGPVYFLVTSALLVDTTVDSQKKRKPGVGS